MIYIKICVSELNFMDEIMDKTYLKVKGSLVVGCSIGHQHNSSMTSSRTKAKLKTKTVSSRDVFF